MKKNKTLNILKKALSSTYFLSLALLAAPVGLALAGSVPYNFTPGTLIKASEVIANFSDLNGRSWDISGSDLYFSGGNVGIGTSSPGYKLTVNGSLQLTPTLGSVGFVQSSYGSFTIDAANVPGGRFKVNEKRQRRYWYSQSFAKA